MGFRSGTSGQATTTDLVLNKPSGTVEGDLLLVFTTAGAVGTPVGWTQVFDQLVSNSYQGLRLKCMYRYAGASEPASYTFVNSSRVRVYGTLHAYSGITGEPVLGQGVASDADGANPTSAPSVALTTPGLLVVATTGQNGSGHHTAEWSVPSGMTRRLAVSASHDVSGTNVVTALATNDQPVPGEATGARSANFFRETNPDMGGVRIAASVVLRNNIAPHAPLISIPASVDRTRALVVDVGFSDPDVGDSPSRSAVRHRPTGVTPLPAWTVVTRDSPNTNVTIPADTLTAGQNEVQGQSADKAGLTGPWSASVFVKAVNPPAGHTFTSPAAGSTISKSSQRFTLSNAGTYQSTEWRVLGDSGGSPDESNVLVALTAITTGDLLSFTVTGLANSQTVHVQARAVDSGVAGPWATTAHLVSYTPPTSPAGSVSVLPAALAVRSANPTPANGEPAATHNEIERRVVGSGAGRFLRDLTVSAPVRLLLAPNTTHEDWTVVNGVDYEYRFHAVASNGTRTAGPWVSGPVDLSGVDTGDSLDPVEPTVSPTV